MICLLMMNISFWRVVNIMAVLSWDTIHNQARRFRANADRPVFTTSETAQGSNVGQTYTVQDEERRNPTTGIESDQQRRDRQRQGTTPRSAVAPPTRIPPIVPPPPTERAGDPRTATRYGPRERTATPPTGVPYAPPKEYVPQAGNVRNLIVEEVLQRNDQIYTRVFGELGELRGNFRIVPESGKALVRQMPQDANPYLQLPEEFRVGDPYGDLERPLDLLRYKTDQFWNLLDYIGQYEPEALNGTGQGIPGQILPFESVRVDTDLSTQEYEYPIWRQGDIGGAIDVATNNPFNVHHKELIELTANPSVFGSMEDAMPCPEQGTIIPTDPVILTEPAPAAPAPNMDVVATSIAAENPGQAALNARLPGDFSRPTTGPLAAPTSNRTQQSSNQSTTTRRSRGSGFGTGGGFGGGFGGGMGGY